jgi:hypothetical protein
LHSNLKLISAAKTILKITGMYMLQLEIFGKTLIHPVHICESMNQVGIIGMDVIAKLGLTYLANKKAFIFGSHLQVDNNFLFPNTVFQNATGVVVSVAVDRTVHIPLPPTPKKFYISIAIRYNCRQQLPESQLLPTFSTKIFHVCGVGQPWYKQISKVKRTFLSQTAAPPPSL